MAKEISGDEMNHLELAEKLTGEQIKVAQALATQYGQEYFPAILQALALNYQTLRITPKY